ncbi:MAG: hypothetical protein AAF399_05335, partial [Bacteroidota bacterium]
STELAMEERKTMNGFMWFLLIMAGIFFGLRIFGKKILLFTAKRLTQRLMKQAEAESRKFSQHYDHGASNRTNVYVDEDIKVSAPKSGMERMSVQEDEIAEDIEFEELSGEKEINP